MPLTLRLVGNMKAKSKFSTYLSIMAIQSYILSSEGPAGSPLSFPWSLSMAFWISPKSPVIIFRAWLGASDIFLFTLVEPRIVVHNQRPWSICKLQNDWNVAFQGDFSAYPCHWFIIRTLDFGEIHSEITYLGRNSKKFMMLHQN